MAEFLVASAVSTVANFAINLLFRPSPPDRNIEARSPSFRSLNNSYGPPLPKIYNLGRVGANYVDPRNLKEIYQYKKTVEETETGGGKGGGGSTTVREEKIETFGTAIALLAGGEYDIQKLFLNGQIRYDSSGSGLNFFNEYFFFASGSDTQPPWSVIDSIHQNNSEATQTYRGNAYLGLNKLPLRGEGFSFGDSLPQLEVNLASITTYDLADIVAEHMRESGIPDNKFDVGELVGISVRGFIAKRGGEARSSNLRTLAQTYFIFPAKGVDGVIYWRTLGRPEVEFHDIPLADLACHPSGDNRPYNWRIEETPPDELPGKAVIRSADPDLDLETGTTEILYPIGDSENVIDVETQGVFTSEERETIARKLLQQAWTRRTRYFDIFLPATWLEHIDTGDVLQLPLDDSGSIALVQVDNYKLSAQDPPLLQIEGSAYDSTSLTQAYNAPSAPRDSGTIVDNSTGTPATLYLLDIPKIKQSHSDLVIYCVADKPSDLFVSADGGASYQPVGTTNTGFIASCDTTLADAPSFTLDNNGGIQYEVDINNTIDITIEVSRNNGISQISNAEFENFANIAFIGRQINGKWEGELVVFRDVTSLGGDQYRIGHFIRGFAGTEGFTGSHTIGEKFFLLSGQGSAITRVQGQQSLLNRTIQFKARLEPFQNLVDITPISLTIEGEASKPYAPFDLQITQSASGDFYFRAIPRLRLEPFGFTGPFPSPGVDFGGEQYKLVITNGRTIESDSFPIQYSAEDQVTDFGSVQTSISGELKQINVRVGTEGFATTFSSATPNSESVPPSIDSVSGAIIGEPLLISGSEFTGTSSIVIAGTPVASFTVISDSLVEAVPDGGTSSGELVLTTPAGSASFQVALTTMGGANLTDGQVIATDVTLGSGDHNKQFFADATINVTLPDSATIGTTVVECSFVKKSGSYIRFVEASGVTVYALGRYQYNRWSKVRVQFFPSLGGINNVYYLEGELDNFRVDYCQNSAPSAYIIATISPFLLTYSADQNSVTWCNNSAPSTYIADVISAFQLTYSADQNSITWCNNSAPSALIAAT